MVSCVEGLRATYRLRCRGYKFGMFASVRVCVCVCVCVRVRARLKVLRFRHVGMRDVCFSTGGKFAEREEAKRVEVQDLTTWLATWLRERQTIGPKL